MKSTIKGLEFVISISAKAEELSFVEGSIHNYSGDNNQGNLNKHGTGIVVDAELKFGIEEMESETTPEEVKGLFDLISDALHKEVHRQVEEQLETAPQEEEDKSTFGPFDDYYECVIHPNPEGSDEL